MTSRILKSKLLPKVIAIGMVVLFFVLLEAGCLLVEKKSRLDNILAILDEDSQLFWKQRNHLDTDFFGGHVTTGGMGLRVFDGPETGGSADFRVLILGASPTFGWGVHDNETYAAELSRKLNRDFKDPIAVINGAGVGYSSYQGLTFLKKHIDVLKPDLITVSYVINDVDNYRFFQNNGIRDKKVKKRSPLAAGINNMLIRSAFCRFLGRTMANMKKGLNKKKAAAEPGAVDYSVYPGENRVSREDYRANLLEFQRMAAQRGIELVFIKMPVNLPLGPDILSESRGKEFFDAGKALYHKSDYPKAAAAFQQAVHYNPILSKAYYYLGQCALASDRPGCEAEAEEHFTMVKKSESFQCARDALKYNRVMEEVAAEKGVPLVDIVAAFKQYTEYLWVDPDSDTIHPNKLGHSIIGGRLYQTVGPMIPAEVGRK